MRSTSNEQCRVVGLLAVGVDGSDGHKRITETDSFLLVGGSEQTHERMQETAMLFEEALERRGKTLADTGLTEIIDLLHEAREAVSG